MTSTQYQWMFTLNHKNHQPRVIKQELQHHTQLIYIVKHDYLILRSYMMSGDQRNQVLQIYEAKTGK